MIKLDNSHRSEVWRAWGMLEQLKFAARFEAMFTTSYRRFQVGAAALVHAPDFCCTTDGADYQLISACNHKHPNQQKDCAEMHIVRIAEEIGAKEILMMVVAGELQRENITGKKTKTLHSCEECRNLMRHNRLFKEDTTLHFVNLDTNGVYETYKLYKFLFEYQSADHKAGVIETIAA